MAAQRADINEAEVGEKLAAASHAFQAGDARQAVRLYQECLKEEALPKASYLDYARALQTLGLYHEALRWFQAYLDSNPGDEQAENGIFACRNVKHFRRNPFSIHLILFPKLNSGASEHHPFYSDGHLLFLRETGDKHEWLVADTGNLNLPLQTGIAALLPSGAVDFDILKDTSFLVFAQKKEKDGNCQLFLQRSIISGPVAEKLLPFCRAGYNACYPTWSPDGRFLFFSSDRPGGYGGMDIWFLPRDSLFVAAPKNAGPLVNTAGDELAPAFSPAGILVFSSNGHPGLGGFDLFEIKMDDSAHFMDSITHLGAPINSGYDDLEMTWISAGDGFLTSSRPGSQGLLDIFKWKSARQELHIEVFDSSDHKALSRVRFYSMDEEGKMQFLGISDMQGQFSFLVKNNLRDKIKLERDGYEPYLLSPSIRKSAGNTTELRISLRREIDVRIAGVVKNKAEGTPLAAMQVSCTGPENDTILLSSDSAGRFLLEAKPGERWIFDIHCDGYLPVHEELQTEAGRKHAIYNITLWLNPLIKGRPIVLQEILFKYKSTEIDEEASKDLMKLLDMLIENPELVVEISTHTDSRGGYQYNEILSQKRAQAVVDWLVTRGVAPSRLVARGYGEYHLVNECADSVPCPEWKHRQNRRAEVKILGTRDSLKGLVTAADQHWDIDPKEIPIYVPDSLERKRQLLTKNKINPEKHEDNHSILPKKKEEISSHEEVYFVQFAASTRADDRFPAAEHMGPLATERFGRFTRFMIGPLPTLDQAYHVRDRLREKGLKDAFLVAYRDGHRLNIRY